MTTNPRQLSSQTYDTLFIATWLENGVAAITAGYRHASGEVEPLTYRATGPPLPTLSRALADLRQVDARHCLVLTNEPVLARMYQRPFQYSSQRPPTEWPPVYFDVLRHLTLYCLRGTWRCTVAADLPKARELWQQQQRQNDQ